MALNAYYSGVLRTCPVLFKQVRGLKTVTLVQIVLHVGQNDSGCCVQGPFEATNARKRVQSLQMKPTSDIASKQMKTATGVGEKMESPLKEGLLDAAIDQVLTALAVPIRLVVRFIVW